MLINKSLFKIICLCSLITGSILGFIPLIPPLVWIAFLAVMFLISPFIITYLRHLNLIKDVNMEQSLVIGAISGASAFIGFSAVYFPIAFILNLIFKIQSFLWIKVVFANIGFLITTVILTSLLCALLNMFSGFLTVYIYDFYKLRK